MCHETPRPTWPLLSVSTPRPAMQHAVKQVSVATEYISKVPARSPVARGTAAAVMILPSVHCNAACNEAGDGCFGMHKQDARTKAAGKEYFCTFGVSAVCSLAALAFNSLSRLPTVGTVSGSKLSEVRGSSGTHTCALANPQSSAAATGSLISS